MGASRENDFNPVGSNSVSSTIFGSESPWCWWCVVGGGFVKTSRAVAHRLWSGGREGEMEGALVWEL